MKEKNPITYEERAAVYTAARETFGDANQLMKALEELTEVKLEIHRALDGRGDLLHLAEEVADAFIMLEQVRQIFGIDAEVQEAMDGKILRLRQRIEEAKTKHSAPWTPTDLLDKYKIKPKEE